MFGHQDDSLTTATPAQTVNPAFDNTPLDAPGTPAPLATPSPAPTPTPASPATGLELPSALGAPMPSASASNATDTGTTTPDDLLSIKQQALQQLSPLVGHLDQTPEERFRTTMMMIQAADNQDLLKSAYDAAQGISDEKARAQALLDIVNEINYFTQRQQQA